MAEKQCTICGHGVVNITGPVKSTACPRCGAALTSVTSAHNTDNSGKKAASAWEILAGLAVLGVIAFLIWRYAF